MRDTSSVSLAADTSRRIAAERQERVAWAIPSRGRQGAVLTCENCEFVRDEPWAGKREICHRCMAPGECQGYAVGFDQIWTSPPPAWCGRRRSVEARSFGAASGLAQDDEKEGATSSGADAPSALKDPPVFESRGELHPGAMDAPMAQTRAAASDRWAALAEQLRGHLSVTACGGDSSP